MLRHARPVPTDEIGTGRSLCGKLLTIEWDRYDELDFEKLPLMSQCPDCAIRTPKENPT